MKTALDPRHVRRQKIVQELFAWNANRHTKLADSRSLGVADHIHELDKIIKECAPEWEITKINPIDLAILRAACFELAFEHTEPPKVIIDEAIELAKEFGNESSPAFINGALGKALTNRERILLLVADKFGIEREKLLPDAHLKTDLNVTDMEVADLTTMLEQELGLPIGKAASFATIGELLEFIEEQA